MRPSYYECTSCRERFHFAFSEGYYNVGPDTVEGTVREEALLAIPTRPAWCKDCGCLCIVEDIAPLRSFEAAYAMVRQGRAIEYPAVTEFLDVEAAVELAGAYLRWRFGRAHPARTLCCGGRRYVFMDEALPLIKHAECDFGVVEPVTWIGSVCSVGPGVVSPANLRLYTSEGDLVGLLTWHRREKGRWDVEPTHYPP